MRYGPMDILRAGPRTDMAGATHPFQSSDLVRIAAAYDAEKAPAPIVVGNPSVDAPAQGWVESLAVDGDRLTATFDASPEFVAWVKAKGYETITASFFMIGASSNPKPEIFYLKHVGFNGGTPPVVANLAPVGFALSSGFLCFAEDRRIAEHAAMQRRLSELELERLMDEGRVLPFFRDEIIAFADSLDNQTVIAFAEGEAKPQRAWFMDYLQRMPPVVDFSVLPKDDWQFQRGGASQRKGNFPAGREIDPDGESLFHQATALATKESISFAEAVGRIGSETGA